MSEEKPVKTRDKKPEERETGKPEPYAYTIKDKAFGEFKILNSANAWWIDRRKVEDLIAAYKIDANDEEACSYAGISLEQLRYFRELHDNFSQVKRACHQILGLKAKMALAQKVETEPEWYLERKRKDEYSTRQENTGADGRALFEQQDQKLVNLVEEVRQMNKKENAKKHASKQDGHNAHAEQGGAGRKTTPADIKTT